MTMTTRLRPKRILSRRTIKTLNPARPNAGVGAWYHEQLQKNVNEMHKSVMYWISANYRNSGAMAMDASPAMMMREAMRKLIKRWQSKFDDVANELARRFAGRVMKNTDASLQTSIKGEDMTVAFKMTPEMNNAYQAVIGENVGLIKSIPSQYLSQIEVLVMQSVGKGGDLATLTKALQNQYGVTKRRASLIARDQNNKATTTMQIARQQSVGIKEGIWRHSHAGKVPRQSHVKANGERFDLSKGLYLDGKWVLPGQEINCRCFWQPVIPGISD